MTHWNHESPGRWHQRSLVVTAGQGLETAHNPKVAGSNPAPATKAPGQRPFPLSGEGLCRCRRRRPWYMRSGGSPDLPGHGVVRRGKCPKVVDVWCTSILTWRTVVARTRADRCVRRTHSTGCGRQSAILNDCDGLATVAPSDRGRGLLPALGGRVRRDLHSS